MNRKAVDRKDKRRSIAYVGIDEVGRGPLAGPMVIAAVWGISASDLAGIRDSKKLSPKKREAWYKVIRQKGMYRVVSIPAHTIDKIGISRVARSAIERLMKGMDPLVVEILLDGGLHAPREYRQKTIIKGDEKIPLIAAASIMAKVTRDRWMVRISRRYPKYQFDTHKGYGTAAHIAVIRAEGLSKIHRKTFCKNFLLHK